MEINEYLELMSWEENKWTILTAEEVKPFLDLKGYQNNVFGVNDPIGQKHFGKGCKVVKIEWMENNKPEVLAEKPKTPEDAIPKVEKETPPAPMKVIKEEVSELPPAPPAPPAEQTIPREKVNPPVAAESLDSEESRIEKLLELGFVDSGAGSLISPAGIEYEFDKIKAFHIISFKNLIKQFEKNEEAQFTEAVPVKNEVEQTQEREFSVCSQHDKINKYCAVQCNTCSKLEAEANTPEPVAAVSNMIQREPLIIEVGFIKENDRFVIQGFGDYSFEVFESMEEDEFDQTILKAESFIKKKKEQAAAKAEIEKENEAKAQAKAVQDAKNRKIAEDAETLNKRIERLKECDFKIDYAKETVSLLDERVRPFTHIGGLTDNQFESYLSGELKYAQAKKIEAKQIENEIKAKQSREVQQLTSKVPVDENEARDIEVEAEEITSDDLKHSAFKVGDGFIPGIKSAGFFSQLAAFNFQQLNFTMSKIDEEKGLMSIVIKPVNFSGEPKYDQIKPLTIEGTLEELDNGFFKAISNPMEVVHGLMSNAKSFLDDLAEKEKQTAQAKKKKEEVAELVKKAKAYHEKDTFDITSTAKRNTATKKYDEILELDPENKDALSGKKLLLEQADGAQNEIKLKD